MALVEVKDLSKTFYGHGALGFGRGIPTHAVDGVSFEINAGEALGLVGESGSGKTTVARMVLGLLQPSGGRVIFEGSDVRKLSRAKRRDFRCSTAVVFQDPYASLNPRMKVADTVAEPLVVNGGSNGAERKRRVRKLFEDVGLAAEHEDRYPHQLSGGQRQRVGIARALALEPKLIVCDEPVSALDVSIRAQILNLLAQLRTERGLAYLFIAHDLAVVRYISDRVAVMQEGKLVEVAGADRLYADPQSAYTKRLLAAIPIPDPKLERARRRR